MASVAAKAKNEQSQSESLYRKRILAWTMYDWANSAFATTIMAALLPAYFSGVAGATLPSAATATAYWGGTNSISLLIIALMSPILGTISDVMRGKKVFLSIFVMIGVIATGLLVLVNTGDWVLAALLYVIGRIGFSGSLIFYDALLPHVARPDDQDRVSAQGYALGYLGGGILLAINVAMFMLIPDSLFENAGVRLSFLSVAIWWLLFSIPIFRDIPEPPAATEPVSGMAIVRASNSRLWGTFRDIRHYRELFKFLVAFLIYNDGIGTIISMATIYGSELGFGLTELVLALLLVQFVGIPFSLIFGSLPVHSERTNKRRPFFFAFILLNLIVMPLIGISGLQALPADVTGARPAAYATVDGFSGEGTYKIGDAAFQPDANWQEQLVAGTDLVGTGFLAALSGTPADETYLSSSAADARADISINGDRIELVYQVGPDMGILNVEINGDPLMALPDGAEEGAAPQPVTIDLYHPITRYDETITLELGGAGQQTVSLINSGEKNEASSGTNVAFAQVIVLPAQRTSSLMTIIGMVFGTQAVLLVIAYFIQSSFVKISELLDTRRSILLSLLVYCAIAVWGFYLDSTIEYWFLAWMVAIVQGGSQALSRSLYSSMCPTSKSGEFFGFFSIMEKFASIIGPLLFAFAALTLGSSRPAILSLIVLFVLGGYLLTRVNIEEGRRVAQEEDAASMKSAA